MWLEKQGKCVVEYYVASESIIYFMVIGKPHDLNFHAHDLVCLLIFDRRCQFFRSLYLQSCKPWLRWDFNDDDMFRIYVYWCSLLLLLGLQNLKLKEKSCLCCILCWYFWTSAYQLKVTLVKSRTIEITSETLVQVTKLVNQLEFVMENLLCFTLFSVRYRQSSATVGFIWCSG